MAEPDGGADHAVTVAFGGRPAGMEETVGQFANAVPIRVALSEVFASKQPSFEALVNLVSTEVSTAKKHDRLSYLDISNAHRKLGLQVPPAQVAITLSPKLSRKECALYPVEGPYDIFFCFLEGDDGVSLGVSFVSRCHIHPTYIWFPGHLRSNRLLQVGHFVFKRSLLVVARVDNG